MTGAQLSSFAVLIAASAVVIVALMLGVPVVARVLFRDRMEAVRDDCVDALIEGRLQRDDSVRLFIESADQTAKSARLLTLPRAFAMSMAYTKLGVSKAPDKKSYCELSPGERKLMHDLEGRRRTAILSYAIWGSPAGWALAPFLRMAARKEGQTGQIAKSRDALPKITSEAAMSEEQCASPAPAPVRWVHGASRVPQS